MKDNDRDVDEDNIDNVEEQVDENQAKNSILKFGQYVQQVDKVSDSIIKYLNEIDNLLIKMPTTINENKN
jgi:flagellar biosynthesis/type III secretory pathway ATPase